MLHDLQKLKFMNTNTLADRHFLAARHQSRWLIFFTLNMIGCIFAFIIAYQNESGLGIGFAMVGGILSAALAIRSGENSRHHMHLYELAIKRHARL